MDKKNELICADCQQDKDNEKLVRKCFDCGCKYCNHNVPKLGIEVTPQSASNAAAQMLLLNGFISRINSVNHIFLLLREVGMRSRV